MASGEMVWDGPRRYPHATLSDWKEQARLILTSIKHTTAQTDSEASYRSQLAMACHRIVNLVEREL